MEVLPMHWNNLSITSGAPTGLSSLDGLRIVFGPGVIKVQRRPNDTGPWLDWSVDCKVTVRGTASGDPFEIVFERPGASWRHTGSIPPSPLLSAGTWMADEG